MTAFHLQLFSYAELLQKSFCAKYADVMMICLVVFVSKF